MNPFAYLQELCDLQGIDYTIEGNRFRIGKGTIVIPQNFNWMGRSDPIAPKGICKECGAASQPHMIYCTQWSKTRAMRLP